MYYESHMGHEHIQGLEPISLEFGLVDREEALVIHPFDIRVENDPKAAALYVRFSRKQIKRSIQLSETVIVDVADDGSIAGLDIQQVWPAPSKLIAGNYDLTSSGHQVRALP